ncbi:hypothetical protein K6U40_14595 [Vibrio fluvialis]|uniref:hypothetical protein n=1 Tax=Vibrio fluvialis TaxID=676 RepID=UPI001F34B5D5|nr:hypothetical protein [Vibrio fluvialis]MCE7641073.1 hypothetical protein [Vibrio fluvialis]MCG6346711.1 hypothetical protein [Vibrio fluvialis]
MMKRQKNSEYAHSKGREMRLDAEHEAYQIGMPAPRTPPLFSNDATLQHYFEQGWKGVSQCDIRLHLGIAPSAVEQMISKTRRAQQCR